MTDKDKSEQFENEFINVILKELLTKDTRTYLRFFPQKPLHGETIPINILSYTPFKITSNLSELTSDESIKESVLEEITKFENKINS